MATRKNCHRLEKVIRRKDILTTIVHGEAFGEVMKAPLIVAMLVISAAPVSAQDQRPNPAKLRADAQKVVSMIRGDKAKSQAFCQLNALGEEIDRAAQARDEQKADVLTKKMNDLEKQLGPEYIVVFDALNNADPNSKDFSDIISLFDDLDKSCPH